MFRRWKLHFKITKQGNECQGQNLGLTEGDSWRANEWCRGPGPRRGPSVISWGNQLFADEPLQHSSDLVQNHVWWRCPCSYDYPPHPIKVIALGHFFLTIKTLLKSPVDLCQGNSVWGVKHTPSWTPLHEKGLEIAVSSQEFFLPRGATSKTLHLEGKGRPAFLSPWLLDTLTNRKCTDFEHEGLKQTWTEQGEFFLDTPWRHL